MSMTWLLSEASFACGLTLTNVTAPGSIPTCWAKAGHITREASPAGLPSFLPAKSFGPAMPLLLSLRVVGGRHPIERQRDLFLGHCRDGREQRQRGEGFQCELRH